MSADQLDEKLLRQKLDAESQKLTEAQQDQLDRVCSLLKENETYKTKHALEVARAIHRYDGTVRLGPECLSRNMLSR